MQIPFNRRAAGWLALTLPMAGCGGGGTVDNIAVVIADAFVCSFGSCIESSTLRVDEISTHFTTEPVEGQANVQVTGYLGKSANVFTLLQLAPNEQLRASADGGAEVVLTNPSGDRMHYSTKLPVSTVRPRVTLVFVRDGVRHASEVVLPPVFSVVEPADKPTLARTAGSLLVRLSPMEAGSSASLSVTGRCSRTDASSFDTKGTLLNPRLESGAPGSYRVDTLALDQALNAESRSANQNDPNTPLVSRWVSFSA